MKKLTKLGLVSFSIFVLNAYSQTVVKADENGDTDTPVALESSTDKKILQLLAMLPLLLRKQPLLAILQITQFLKIAEKVIQEKKKKKMEILLMKVATLMWRDNQPTLVKMVKV